MFDGQWLAGQGGFFGGGVVGQQRAVDRHRLAGAHEQPVADFHVVDGDLDRAGVGDAEGVGGGALEQARQLRTRT